MRTLLLSLKREEMERGWKRALEKRRIYALFIAATILIIIAIPCVSTTLTQKQAQWVPARNLTTPPPIVWSKTYGGTKFDVARSVQQTSDGGFIIAGTTDSFGFGSDDFWLVKIGASGSRQWNKTYGGASGDEAYSVQQTSDDGYIVAGYTGSFGAGGYDLWLVKTDTVGNLQWSKSYGGTMDDHAYSVQQTSDGGYVVAGYTYSFGAIGSDFWVVKTDSSGNMQWNKTYGGTMDDYAYSVQQTSDGGYVVAGYSSSFGANGFDLWLVKIDSGGILQWIRTYGGISDDYAFSIQQTSDGGYIVAGYTRSFGAGGADFWLLKTDSAGSEQWNQTYGGTDTDAARSVQQTSDGGYIVAGVSTSFGAGGTDFWVVKTDSSGNMQWNKTYGGTMNDYAQSVQQTSDGGYVVAGYTYSFGAGGTDFWVVKTGDATPPSTVVDLAVIGATRDSLTLTWTAPGDEWNVGTARGYVVKYSTAGQINEANWDSATALDQSWIPKANGTTETFIISGLSSNTKYWFAVRGYDEASNYGGVSNSPSGTTLTASAVGLSAELLTVVALFVVAVPAVLVLLFRKKSGKKKGR